MAEKWKHNAAKALERLAYGVEKLADEQERYNDKEEEYNQGIDPRPKREFYCPECKTGVTIRATTDVDVTLDCNDGHPVQEMVEEDEVA